MGFSGTLYYNHKKAPPPPNSIVLSLPLGALGSREKGLGRLVTEARSGILGPKAQETKAETSRSSETAISLN